MSDKTNKQKNQSTKDTMQEAYQDLLSIFRRTQQQSSTTEDGDDAIVRILRFLKADITPVPDEIENPLERLEYMLRPTGIMHRRIELTGTWWKETTGPLLGTRNDGSVVALIPAFPAGYTYCDKQTGKTIHINKQTAKDIGGEAFCFYRTFPLRPLHLKDILGFLFQSISKGDILWIVLASLFVSVLGMVTPYLNKLIFNSIIPSNILGNILPITGLLVGATIGGLLFGISRQFVLTRFHDKISVSVESAAMARIFSLPASFFKQHTVGELYQRIGGMTAIADIMISTVFTTGLSSLFSFVYIFQMISFAPSLVAPGLLIILGTLLFICLSIWIQSRILRKQAKISAKLNGMVFGLIGGVQKIKLSGAEGRAFAKWAKLYAQDGKLRYNPPFFLKINAALSTAIALGGTILLYYTAGTTEVSQSDYMAFSAAYGAVSAALLALSGVMGQLANLRPQIDLIQPLMDAQPEIGKNKKQVTKLTGKIEIAGVNFRYGEDLPWVVSDFNLDIKPGEYVGIVGKSGCGKSTLMRLMIGFEKPETGAIYFDEENLDTLDLRSLRQRVGVDLQNGKLFAGDIFSNITITAPWSTMDDAWEAARLAGIDEDIRCMPMGMMTLISEGGGGISGGQKQRILIARALVGKPKILMFDEATSALDNVVQNIVAENISKLGCTRIVIAHRLSTVKHCDRIILMEHGNIAEQGTYEQLMKQKGLFYEFAKRQI